MALLVNAKARFDYTISQTFWVGMVLTGGEVKSLRHKSGSLTGSYVKIMGGEAFLINAQISPYKFADNRDYDPKRTRKLLLKRHELEKLLTDTEQKGIVLVPLAIESKGRHLKLEVGIGRGKKQYEKRAVLRQRDIERDIRKQFKDKITLR